MNNNIYTKDYWSPIKIYHYYDKYGVQSIGMVLFNFIINA